MNKNKILITIGMIIFIDNIGAGMIMPLLPTLFMNSHLGLIELSSMATRSFYFGLSYMLFPIVTIVSNPYFGHLSDYKGRRFVIIAGMIGLIVANLMTVVSIITHNLWLFLFTRLISGIFSGSYAAASAALMDISNSAEEKVKNIKLITLISILGFIISPALSVLVPNKLTEFSISIPFVVVFLLSMINLLLIIMFFPKAKCNTSDGSNTNLFNTIFTSFFFIFKTRSVLRIAIILFVFQLGYSFYLQTMALNLQQVHNFSIRQTGIFFLVIGICYTFGMYVIHTMFNRYFSNKWVTNISILFASILIGVLGLNELTNLSVVVNHALILWGGNILFFVIIPMASINLFKQFTEVAVEKQGLVMGVAGQISALALISSAILVSFHIYFGQSSLLITSFIMLTAFIIRIMYDKSSSNKPQNETFVLNN